MPGYDFEVGGSILNKAVGAHATLSDMLADRAARSPHRVAFRSVNHDLSLREVVTYGALLDRASTAAAALAERCEPGDRVLLLSPDPIEHLTGLFGCATAGLVAVSGAPPYAPRRTGPRHLGRLARLAGILNSSGATAVTGPADLLGAMRDTLDLGDGLDLITTEAIAAGKRSERLPRPSSDLAFLQYTSGSTAAPRGVALSHSNLLANLSTQAEGLGVSEADVGVSWLPLFHDLGLIGAALLPIYAGFPCLLMPSAGFLERPRRWLEAISEHRATISWAPNFAFNLCLRMIEPQARAGLDLGAWRIAMNAAEPVGARTVEAFCEAFEPYGFRAAALRPCYGLAEATLGVSAPAPGEAPIVLSFDRASLGRGLARPALAGAPAEAVTELVACGAPAPRVGLAIVDPETARPCADQSIGEIWVAGPGVATGYFGDPEGTAAVFGARIEGDPASYLRTGDLGFMSGGRLFIAGRLKDVIILRGVNIYPQDLEASASRSHPAVREDATCAISLVVDEEETLVVVCELNRGWKGAAPETAQAVRRAIHDDHGLEARAVILLPFGALPRTPSGKVQRQACRIGVLDDELPVIFRHDLASPRPPPSATAADGRLEFLPWLRQRLGALAGGEIPGPETHLADLGVDSIEVTALVGEIQTTFGRRIPAAEVFEARSLYDIAALFEAQVPG